MREYADAARRAAPALAIAAIKRCVHEGGELPLAERARARGRADGAAVPAPRTPTRDCTRSSRSASRSSWAHEHAMTTHPGSFIDGRRASQRRRPARWSSIPRTAARSPRLRPPTEARRRRRRRARRPTRRRRGPSSPCPSAARFSGAPRTTSRSTSTSWSRCSPASRARRSATRRIEITKAVDTLHALRRPVEGAPRRPHAEPRPRRRRHGAADDRSGWSARSCRGTSRRRCCATSSRRRWWPGNTVVAKPAATTPLTTLRFAELLAEGGLPEGVFNVDHRHAARAAGEALVDAPDRAQDRLHRLDPGGRADHGPVPRTAPSA